MRKLFITLLLISRFIQLFAQDAINDSVSAATKFTEAKGLFYSDRTACLNKALAALEIADRINNKPLEGNINNLLGILYSYQAKYDLSLNYLNKALVFANTLNDNTLKSKVYTNIGLNYMQQGDQLKAIDASLKAVEILEAIGKTDGVGSIYANISNSYYALKMPDKALEYDGYALKNFQQTNQQTGIANVYNSYGVIFSDQKQHQKALEYYSKSLKIKQALNDFTGVANSLLNIGALYIDTRSYQKSLENLKKAKVLFEKNKDPKGLAEVAQEMANLKSAMKDTTDVLDSQKAYDYAKKNTTIEQQRDIAFDLAGKYRDRKDYRNSLKYYAIYDSLKDISQSTIMLKQANELEARYQNEKKKQQIRLLNEQTTVQQLQLSQKNMILLIIGGVFLLFLVISYQFYNRYKLKQAAVLRNEVLRQQELATKGIIQAEERERKRIAGELHDGVGQLFTTVKMNMEILMERYLIRQPAADILAEKTMALVDESCAEVRSIAHQMMPNALIKSGLVSALRDFINKIPAEKLKISMETTGIDMGLENTTETVLYRVIQESVNNVIKHAEATALDILLLCDKNEITVSIEDNGKGFNTDDKNKFTGIGLKNMISRVEYLKGSVDISSSPGKGTLVAIFIPNN
ncbi:sensor histidine kinase [uncultured Mucilaginibacter sp.]|uniref:tetratricopeptide repeat-containing sensor histidine kinase n=1 Tax=uncultured Mucilaginibacter sp. TaxID=797541 RepID=UPI0025E0531E|nr:sensor histidine kinase [uncultured Mucilaginibacter sp.]